MSAAKRGGAAGRAAGCGGWGIRGYLTRHFYIVEMQDVILDRKVSAVVNLDRAIGKKVCSDFVQVRLRFLPTLPRGRSPKLLAALQHDLDLILRWLWLPRL